MGLLGCDAGIWHIHRPYQLSGGGGVLPLFCTIFSTLCPQNISQNSIDIPNYMGSHLEVTLTQCSDRELTGGLVSVIHTRWQERIFSSCAPSSGAILKFREIRGDMQS
jgi:hypothetical protein